MSETQAESSIALLKTDVMTTRMMHIEIASVEFMKDVLNGALAMVKKMMVASEKSIARSMVMM